MKNSTDIITRILILCTTIFTGISINAQVQKGDGGIPYLMHKGIKASINENTFTTASGDSNVTLIGRWANGPCMAAAINGNTAYFGNGGYLEIADITNPANPVELSKVLLPSVVGGIAISGNYVYVANHKAGLRIIDVNNPAAPYQAGFFDTGAVMQSVFT